ncbi:MAG: radical SAM protein [Elusimicrobia bacterium]|nr:radical SAM protein [Elusimicrobiota bacterium]
MDKKMLADRFTAIGAGFAINARSAKVTLSLLDENRALEARELFYNALNGLEPFFTVFIRGMPFCFMPDAADHILYRRRAGRSYAAISQCKACALKALCPGIGTGSVFYRGLRRALKPVLAVPNEIVFELTKRCGLACRVCFAGGAGGERPLRELKALLREARGLGIKNVRFTGGEPFLSPSLLPLLKAAKKTGFYTLVNTNACCADTALLKKAAPLIDNVLVSMQGYDAAGEEAATGVRGLFPRKLSNMRRLRSAVPAFRVGTVASKDLLKNFKAYRALAVKLEADIWEIYRPMLDKKAEAAGPEFRLAAADLKRLSAAIAALKTGGPRVLLANPAPLCLVPAAERKNLLGAAFDDGHTRLVYDPRGFFKPSYYIGERLGGDIKRAWNSDYMRALRSFSWTAPRCKACDYLLKCLCGSRFQAASGGGDYFGRDPWLPK